jgi:1,4-dihydroxy-2-naphthoyl-CoA hydrolase
MRIWKVEHIPIEALEKRKKGTMMDHLGIEYVAVGDDYIEARMPVDERTRQPMGILHGGAHVALAESIGSLASNLCLDNTKEYAVGLDINSNHLKSISSGYVHGIAKPIHIGKKTHVWEIKIYNETKDQLLNISRLTMMVMRIG